MALDKGLQKIGTNLEVPYCDVYHKKVKPKVTVYLLLAHFLCFPLSFDIGCLYCPLPPSRCLDVCSSVSASYSTEISSV